MSTEDALAELADAREALDEADDRVAEVGEDTLRRLEGARDDLVHLLDAYEGRATGSGDFQAYVEFQDEVVSLVESLPEDLPRRETFEDVSERFEKRRLTERDFEAAREALAPVNDLVERLEDRSAARDRYEAARRAAESRLHEIDREIERLERVADLAEADLDAPVENLRDPLEAYNEAVESAFQRFRSEASARRVIDFVETTQAFPLARFPAPPDDLADYLATSPAGEETIATLLEYADYTRSKLSHYVEQPQTFKRVVGGNRTYFTRLDAEPLQFDWPPAGADQVRWRADELVSVVNRFATDDTIEHLERVKSLARDEPHFEHLRTAALAREELSPDERERVEAGIVGEDLATLREERERLADALDEY
ncbi:MAG: hypothetical protein ABEJ76_04835 [Halanaeroarchaeum sp.]